MRGTSDDPGAQAPARGDEPAEFRALTSTRGIAALTVAIYHLLFEYDSSLGGHLSGPIAKGYLCVDYFFVLSGFVITYAYRRYFENGFSLARYRMFMLRRVGRIYPLYASILTCLLVYTLLIYGNFHSGPPPAVQSHYPLQVTVANYLLVFDWGLRIHGFVGASWSISTEMAAYVVFPLILAACFARGALRWSAALAASLAVLVALSLTHPSFDLFEGPASLLRCLAEFSLGVFAFRLYVSGHRLAAALSWDPALGAVIVVAAAMLAIAKSDLAVVLCFPLLVAGLARSRGRIARVLETPVLHWLGLVSYSVYLVHPQWQHLALPLTLRFQALGLPAGAALAAAVAVLTAAILATSQLTYRYIEVKGRRAFRALSEPARTAPHVLAVGGSEAGRG